MRRRDLSLLGGVVLVAVVLVRILGHAGVHSSALRIGVLALIVAAILYTRIGPPSR
jgi:hypothetical protein